MAKRKTHEEFVQEIYEKYGDEYKVIGQYINSKTKVMFRHKCGNLLSLRGDSISCKYCSNGTRKLTHKTYVEKLRNEHGNEYVLLNKYVNSRSNVKVKHNVEDCGYVYETRPHSLLAHGCPICNGSSKQIPEEYFLKKIRQLDEGRWEILSKYKGIKNKIEVKHHCRDGGEYIQELSPKTLIGKINKGQQKCPRCAGVKQKNSYEFIEAIKDKYGDEYEVIGKYKNANTKILVRHNCDKCNHYEWLVKPGSLLRRNGCPVCSNPARVVIKGINDVATTHPHLVKYFVNKEDAYKYSYGADRKVKLICPDCKSVNMIKICNLSRHGFRCNKCSDNISYPEKFMINVLEQLNIKYKTQYSPDWIKPKRYDFYIPSLNCIIETHGEQHYDGRPTSFKTTLKKQQANDRCKSETALVNGIRHYIELDCRESNIEYIKNSALNSELAGLLDLSKIDWIECAEFANKNIVKEVCDYWNNKKEWETTTDLGKVFKTDRSTVRKYLKKGTKLGLCNYSAELEKIKKNKRVAKIMQIKYAKSIVVLKDGKNKGIYNSAQQAAKDFNIKFNIQLNKASIREVATGRKKTHRNFVFRFVEDLTEEEKEKYNIPQKLKENGGGNNE